MLTLVAPPESRDLTTIATLRAAATAGRLTLPDNDAVMARLITAASDAIVAYCRREFARAGWVETLGSSGGPRLMLTQTPLVFVDVVHYRGVVIDPEGWVIEDAEAGIIFRRTRWQDTRLANVDIETTPLPGTGAPDFSIDYTAGYVLPSFQSYWIGPALPGDLEQACILTVVQWLQTQVRDLTIQNQKIGDYSTTFFAGLGNVGGAQALAIPIQQMLAPYRRVV